MTGVGGAARVVPYGDRAVLLEADPAVDPGLRAPLPGRPPDRRPLHRRVQRFRAGPPVAGGYPVLAVVVTADLGAAAQARPGDVLRFRAV